MKITLLSNETREEIEIPSKCVVCPRCRGKGTQDHPAFANGITEEMWDRDWGEEEREDYRRGFYDVKCEECGGRNVIDVPDFDRMDESLAIRVRSQILEREESDSCDRSEARFFEMCDRGARGDY